MKMYSTSRLEQLPPTDVIRWNILLSRYVKCGYPEQALACFERMQKHNIFPSAVTFVCSLKACSSARDTEKGMEFHADICRRGLEINQRIGSALVDMYAKCGLFPRAQEVFEKLTIKDTVSWTTLIARYIDNGNVAEALFCLEKMIYLNVVPDAVTYACILKGCGSIGNIQEGQEIHSEICRRELLASDLLVGNALIDMYGKCGNSQKAKEVFDNVSFRDIITWNALITGYVQNGQAGDALHLFEMMKAEGISPDSVTYVSILKACVETRSVNNVQELHSEIVRRGFLQKEKLIWNAIINIYCAHGLLKEAEDTFYRLNDPDVSSWNTLITEYILHQIDEEVLNRFARMQLQGACPDSVTYACILKACALKGDIGKGKFIHAVFSRDMVLQQEVMVGNALVDLYIKCGRVSSAYEVFTSLPVQNVVTWNTLITGFVHLGHYREALNCFDIMQDNQISSDSVTYLAVLKACSGSGATEKGEIVYAMIVKAGLLIRDVAVGNALVDFYGKCGMLTRACAIFQDLSVQDIVSWNALIASYAILGHVEAAFNCFDQMQLRRTPPDSMTFTSILKVCSSIGILEKSREIHNHIIIKGLEEDTVTGNTLVDVYFKCGCPNEAQEMFGILLFPDEVSWTTLITGHAQFGDYENVFIIFNEIMGKGIKITEATFVSVLNACSHSGELDRGLMYSNAMLKNYGVIPAVEHLTCIVDLLGRAGQLEKALMVINDMPSNLDLVAWHSMLGSCQKSGNIEAGLEAFKHAVQIDESNPVSYITIFNIFSDLSME